MNATYVSSLIIEQYLRPREHLIRRKGSKTSLSDTFPSKGKAFELMQFFWKANHWRFIYMTQRRIRVITFFNRREVAITRSMEEDARICALLLEHYVESRVYTSSPTNPGRHHGVPGINADFAYEYRIYVHRKDYQRARNVLGLSY